MAASSKLMIVEAERRFPCRIKLNIPTGGFGSQLTEMQAWLDENCGADGWATTPAGLRGVVNDAMAIYFLDATLAAAFVSRWCAGSRVEVSEGMFRVREEGPPIGDRMPQAAEAGKDGRQPASDGSHWVSCLGSVTTIAGLF
jgi:hypothetical protein